VEILARHVGEHREQRPAVAAQIVAELGHAGLAGLNLASSRSAEPEAV
jgi:hypothetical protein